MWLRSHVRTAEKQRENVYYYYTTRRLRKLTRPDEICQSRFPRSPTITYRCIPLYAFRNRGVHIRALPGNWYNIAVHPSFYTFLFLVKQPSFKLLNKITCIILYIIVILVVVVVVRSVIIVLIIIIYICRRRNLSYLISNLNILLHLYYIAAVA